MAVLSIHASTLDGFLDCPRRAVANSYPHLIKEAGYEIKETKQYVTGIIGNGVHAGADHLNKDYISTGNLPTAEQITKAAEIGYEDYHKRLLRYMESGDIHHTVKHPNNNTIRAHIADYVKLYAEIVLPTRKLELSEQYFKVKLTDEFQYSSTLDAFGHKTLYDLKTGDKITPAYAQVGTYVYLLRNAGYEVHSAQLDYVTKAQPGKSSLRDTAHHIVIKYDADECMKIAQYATARLMVDLKSFQQTGDINVLLVNPRSESCNSLMCPLYGTKSCGGWKKGG